MSLFNYRVSARITRDALAVGGRGEVQVQRLADRTHILLECADGGEAMESPSQTPRYCRYSLGACGRLMVLFVVAVEPKKILSNFLRKCDWAATIYRYCNFVRGVLRPFLWLVVVHAQLDQHIGPSINI